MWQEILTSVGMLVLMVLVFVGAYWASRFLAARYQGTSGRPGAMRVLEHVPLGKDSKLALVQVQNTIYLLGVGAEQITLLDSFPAEDWKAAPQPDSAIPSFRDVLRTMREKGGGKHE